MKKYKKYICTECGEEVKPSGCEEKGNEHCLCIECDLKLKEE